VCHWLNGRGAPRGGGASAAGDGVQWAQDDTSRAVPQCDWSGDRGEGNWLRVGEGACGGWGWAMAGLWLTFAFRRSQGITVVARPLPSKRRDNLTLTCFNSSVPPPSIPPPPPHTHTHCSTSQVRDKPCEVADICIQEVTRGDTGGTPPRPHLTLTCSNSLMSPPPPLHPSPPLPFTGA
jgi:hypothetical protein